MKIIADNLHASVFISKNLQNTLNRQKREPFEKNLSALAIPHTKFSAYPCADQKEADQKEIENFLNKTDIVFIVADSNITATDKGVIEQILKYVERTQGKHMLSIAVSTTEDNGTTTEGNDTISKAIKALNDIGVSPVFPYFFCEDKSRQNDINKLLKKSLMVEVEMIRYNRRLKPTGLFSRVNKMKTSVNRLSSVSGSARDAMQNNPERTAKDAMQLNLERIDAYYEFSTRQAKWAFVIASILSVASFALFAVIAFISPDSVLSAAFFSAFCEALSGVIFLTYRKSLETLNYYHRSLHEDERFLVCIHFVDQIKDAKLRNEMLQKILLLEMQMNSIDMFVSKGNDNTALTTDFWAQVSQTQQAIINATTDSAVIENGIAPQGIGEAIQDATTPTQV